MAQNEVMFLSKLVQKYSVELEQARKKLKSYESPK